MGKRPTLTDITTSGTETPLDMSKQIVGGGGNVGGAAVNTYYPLNGGNNGSTTINLNSLNCPIAGFISKLTFSSDLPSGAGETVTATLYKNGVATALTCQIAGAVDTFATDGVNTVMFTATDLLTIQVVNSILSNVTRTNWGALLVFP